MKGTSMWQPWASLWLTGRKVHETRGRQFNYRGWLAVCAAKRKPDIDDPELERICNFQFGNAWRDRIPLGSIVGAVLVRSCRRADPRTAAHADDLACGNWGDGRYAILREYAFTLENPIPQKGMQSVVFDINPDAETEIFRVIDKRGWPRE